MSTPRSSSADWKRVADLLADVSAADSAHSMVEILIRRAHALFEADIVICDRFDEHARQIAFQMYPAPTAAFLDLTLEPFHAYWHQHPYQPDWVSDIAHGRVRFLSDRTTHRQFRTTALWNEVYVHLRAKNQLMLGGEIEPNRFFCLSCNRLGRDYSARDRELGQFLQLRLTQVFQNQARRDRAQQSLEILQHAGAAFLVASPNGEVLELSERAREILGFAGPSAARQPFLAELVLGQNDRPNAGTVTAHTLHGTLSAFALRPSAGGPAFVIVGEKHHRSCAGTQPLTPRQAEILHWIGEGKSNSEIAALLGISPRTIGKHCESLFEKLGVESRLAAALLARQSS